MGLRIGFAHELKVSEEQDGDQVAVVLRYREATTDERVQFLVASARLSNAPESRDAMIAEAAQVQEKFGRMVLEEVIGVDVPEGMDARDVVAKYRGQWMRQIVSLAYQSKVSVEDAEGKSEAE